MSPPPVTLEERKLIVMAAQVGTPWSLIARMLKRNRRTVRKVCREAGQTNGGHGRYHHGRPWTLAEVARVAQIVPVAGYEPAGVATGRSASVVRALCLSRLCIESPLPGGRPRSVNAAQSAELRRMLPQASYREAAAAAGTSFGTTRRFALHAGLRESSARHERPSQESV